MRFPHKIISDFLSAQELDDIQQAVIGTAGPENIHYDHGTGAEHNAIIYPFFDWMPKHHRVFEILTPRLRQHFGPELDLDTTHILDARVPYGIHTDVVSGGFDPDGDRDAAWTFIIPLEDYDSHTIVFEQGHDYIKTVRDWVMATDPEPHDIDYQFHQRYLTHTDAEDLRYLTPQSVFAWRAGDLFAADRRCFHVSDDFPAHGIANKRAIIVWSTVPKSQSLAK